MNEEIYAGQDVIDSRDVIARIEYLQGLQEEAPEDEEVLSECEQAELAALEALAGEAEGYAPDWHYGECLIHEGYFTEYIQELAEDCGYLQHAMAHDWPYRHIDWEAAADEAKMDYTAVDFDGETYYIR